MLLSDLFIYLFIEASQQDFLAISYDFKVRSIDKHKKHEGFKQGHSIISGDQHIFATLVLI